MKIFPAIALSALLLSACQQTISPSSNHDSGKTTIAVIKNAEVTLTTMSGSYPEPTALVRAYLLKSGEYRKRGTACNSPGKILPLSNYFKEAVFVENGKGIVLKFGKDGECHFQNHGSTGAELGWAPIIDTVEINFTSVENVYFSFEGKSPEGTNLPYGLADDWDQNG